MINLIYYLIKVKDTMSSPKWMMDSEFDVDDYEYCTDEDDDEDDNNYIPFDEYRNDVLYDVYDVYNVYDLEYEEIDNNSID